MQASVSIPNTLDILQILCLIKFGPLRKGFLGNLYNSLKIPAHPRKDLIQRSREEYLASWPGIVIF